MTIDTKNIQKILEYLQDFDSPEAAASPDLVLSLGEVFIPRLFGSALLDNKNCHYEYLITKNIRTWLKIDRPDERWAIIITRALQRLTEEEIENLPEPAKQKVYRFQASHGMLYNPSARVHQRMREVITRHDQNRVQSDDTKWFYDSSELLRLSLFQNLPDQPVAGIDPSILRAIFDSAMAYGVDSEQLFNYLNTFPPQGEIHEYLNPQQIQQLTRFKAALEQGLKFQKEIEAVTKEGKSAVPNERESAKLRLEDLADDAAAKILSLQPGHSWVYCSKTVAISPKLDATFKEDTYFKLFQQILNSENEEELVNKIMSFLPAEISEGSIASMVPDEAHDILRGALRNGLMQYFFSRITHSLTEGRSLRGRILWTPVEWGRKYLEGKLVEQCNSFSQYVADALSMGFTPEMLEQLRLAIIDENNDLDQVIRDQARLFLNTHISTLRHSVTGMFANVAGMMPHFVNDLCRSFNLGDLGEPAKHLWFSFERQQNNKYSVTLFGTAFKLRNVEPSKIDRDHMLRMLSYAVWPAWTQGASYRLSDIEKGLLIPFDGSQEKIIPPASNNLLDVFNACSHQYLNITPGTREDKLYKFGMMKKAIKDIWTHVQHDSDYFQKNPRALRDLRDASYTISSAALDLFENGGLISLNELKCIYATSKTITLTLQQHEESRNSTLSKHSIAIPPEVLPYVHSLILSAKSSRDSLKTIRELLVDALGDDVGQTIDKVISDLVPEIPNVPDAPPLEVPTAFQELQGWVGRQFWSQVYHHFGFSMELINNPTLFGISYCVSRVSLFILMPAAAIKISITIIAHRAFNDFTEWCFPNVARKISHFKRRLLVFVTAHIFLSNEQKQHFNSVINLWQSKLTHAGKIHYETSYRSQPTALASLRWHKPVVTKEIPFTPALHSSYPLPYQIEMDTKSIVEETGDWLEKADAMLNAKKPLTIICHTFLNAQIQQLPVPLPNGQEDIWSLMSDKEAGFCLEQISELAARLYFTVESKNATLSMDARNRTTVNLFKCLAIIDKLARKSPENHLEGFSINAWALAWWPKSAIFRIIDFQQIPGTVSYHEQLIQIQKYFGIDPQRTYTNQDVHDLAFVQKVLFYEVPGDDLNAYITPFRCGGPADTEYYTKLMDDPAVIRRMQTRGIDENSTKFDKFTVLYRDDFAPNPRLSPQERGVLPRAFKQLRFVFFLASRSFFIDKSVLDIKNVDHFFLNTEKAESIVRKTLNVLTLWHYFNRTEDDSIAPKFKKLPYTKCKVKLGKKAFKINADSYREKHIKPSADPKFWEPRGFEVNPYFRYEYTFGRFPSVINHFVQKPGRPLNAIANSSEKFSVETEDTFATCKGDSIGRKIAFSIVSALTEREQLIDNALSSLPVESRRVVEMMRSHSSDQVVRVVSYFSENIHLLGSPHFLLFLNVLLSHEHVLQIQLKAHPDFSKALGEFFKKAINYLKIKNRYSQELESMIVLGILTKLSVEGVVPNGGEWFPDFTEVLQKTYARRKYLLMLPYLSLNPNTATPAAKRQAIHDICLVLPEFHNSSYSNDKEVRRLCQEVLYLWEPTIRKELNSDATLRDQILNKIQRTSSTLGTDRDLTWIGSYPEFTAGIAKLNLYNHPPITLTDQSERQEIRVQLQKIYGDEVENHTISNLFYGAYFIDDSSIKVKVIEKREGSDTIGQQLCFSMVMDNRDHIWVKSEQEIETGENITYWLEDGQTNGYSQLVVLEKGKVKSKRSVKAQGDSASLDQPREFQLHARSDEINGEIYEKVNLASDPQGLAVLSWFQPLSSIEAYRSTQPPYAWKKIRFTGLNLSFKVEPNESGQLQAFNDAGDFIAQVQHQVDKHPVLASHSRYLLLENGGGEKQVLVPTDSLRSNLASALLRHLSGVPLSPLMESALNTVLNQTVDPKANRKYHTYTFDAQGRLDSDDPEAILHLLCHHMHELLTVSGSAEEVLHYLERLETLANQGRLSSEIHKLCAKMEISALLLNNEEISRLAVRLTALRAKNELDFSNEKDYEHATDSIIFLSWVAAQWNFNRLDRKSESIIAVKEDQELQLLRNVARLSGKMFSKLLDQARSNKELSEYLIGDESIINYLGIDRVAQSLFMLPKMSERLEFLNYKYGPASQQYEFAFQSIVRHMLFGSTAEENGGEVHVSRTVRSDTGTFLECLWEILTDRHTFKFDHEFLHNADLNVSWENLPVRFSEITPELLQSHFFHYYRLAKEEIPPNCNNNRAKELTFRAHSKRFRETLRLMHGKQWGNNTDAIVSCLRILSAAPHKGFPLAIDCELAIEQRRKVEGEREAVLKECSSSSEEDRLKRELAKLKCKNAELLVKERLFSIKSACEKSSLFSNVFSMKNMKGLLSFGTNNIRVLLETAVAGSFSFSGIMNINALAPPMLVPLGRLGIYLSKALPAVKAIYDTAQKERAELNKSLLNGKEPLPANFQVLLDQTDSDLEKACFSLRDDYLDPIHEVEQTQQRRVGPFVPSSDDPATLKWYARVNADLDYYYRHPYQPVQEYRIKGIKNFYQLVGQLQAASKTLYEHLKVLETDILFFAKKRTKEQLPERQLIPNLMKKGNQVKQRTDNAQFLQLLQSLINTDKEMLSLADLKPEQLPQLKLQLYQYLIKATRLQQMQRALIKLEQIGKLKPNDPDLSQLIEEFCFTISQKRAFKLHIPNPSEALPAIPERFIAGYLLLEYGNNMMIWSSQLEQLQKQLLASFEHNNICTEQPTGSGKSTVSNPIVGSVLSNRRYVAWTVLTDDLARPGIPYLTRVAKATVGKIVHVIDVDRTRPLEASNLNSHFLTLLSALQTGDNVISVKRTVQSIELRFLEEIFNFSLTKRDNQKQMDTIKAYAECLDFIAEYVCLNLDELHKHSLRNQELNFPIGSASSKKKLKESYKKAIYYFEYFLHHPKIKRLHNIRDKLQPKFNAKVYNEQIKPKLAAFLSEVPFFEITTEERRKEFVEYLINNESPIPDFVMKSKKRSEIAVLKGLIDEIHEESCKVKINVGFGIPHDDRAEDHAVPFTGNNTPSKISSYRNALEAGLRTCRAYAFDGLQPDQAQRLLNKMHSQAEAEAYERAIPKEDTDTAISFHEWIKPYYKDRPCRLSDFSKDLSDEAIFSELSKAFNQTYAAPLQYALWFGMDDITYFKYNFSSNSQNFVSMPAKSVGGTATTNDSETFFRGSLLIPAPGTIGAHLDHCGNTANQPGSIIEIDAKNPQEFLTLSLNRIFTREVGVSKFTDNGALLNGLSSETVAKAMMHHIVTNNLEWQCVFYFSEEGEQIFISRPQYAHQVKDLKPKPLKSCTVPLNKRAGYFDQVNSLGQDVPQDPKAKFASTFNNNTNAENEQQGKGRARKYKQGCKQTMKTVTLTEVRKLVSGNRPATIDDIMAFSQKNEAEPKSFNNYLSAHQQIDDVTRRTVIKSMVKAILRSGVHAMMPIFDHFKSVVLQETEEDPFVRYGYPKTKKVSHDVLEISKSTQFDRLKNSGLISESDLKEASASFEPLGKGTYPRLVTVDAMSLRHRQSDLGLAQEMVQTQNQQQNQNVHRENQVAQELEQNQHLQMENHSSASRKEHLRIELAEWPANYNHFIDLSWFNILPIQTKTNHRSVILYNVEDTIKHIAVQELQEVHTSFKGAMYWTNNLVGILSSGGLSAPGSEFRVPIFEILVIHYTNSQGNVKIVTCGLHPDEAAAWRNRFREDRASSEDRRNPHIKIGLFDLMTNSIVECGHNSLTNWELFASQEFKQEFNRHVFRWKFLAGQVSIQQRNSGTEALDMETYKQFKEWIEANNQEKMKEAFLKIHKYRGIRPIAGSDLAYLFVNKDKVLVDVPEPAEL